jgi:hypothetical protein
MIDEADQMDDEYYNLGMREPRILITTSRDPSSRLLQFSKVQFTPAFLFILAVEMLTGRKFGLCCRIRNG